MKEVTRQLILLVGVLTLLTSALVTVNMVGSDTESPDDTEEVQNNPEPVNNTTTVVKENSTDENSNSTGNKSRGLIAQSIHGFELMWEDIQTTTGAISSSDS